MNASSMATWTYFMNDLLFFRSFTSLYLLFGFALRMRP